MNPFLFPKSQWLVITLLALLAGTSPTWAEELTVYDASNTNTEVPVNGFYGDNYQKCEFVIPAEDLSAMNGANITALKFYTNWDKELTSTFQVYMKEVEATALTAFTGAEDATTVYTGTITAAKNEIAIAFANEYNYKGGNLLIGFFSTTKGNYANSSNSAFKGKNVDQAAAFCGHNGSSVDAIVGSSKYFIPKTTFTYEIPVVGPGFKVVDYDNGDTFTFGLTNAGTKKALKVKNPGTESVTVNIATTGGFAAASTITLAAKEEKDVEITAPSATANGTITFTPTATGVQAVTLRLSCSIKNPAKMFVDFSENDLPEGWKTVGMGSYTTGSYASSYVWDFSKGYAWYKSSGSNASYAGSYYHSLVSPLIKFAEGEKLLFKVKKELQYSSYVSYLRVDYSADGTTWAAADGGTFNDADLSEDWSEKEISVPATTKQIRFVAAGVGIDDIYGGEESTAPVMKVTAEDFSFGMINAVATTTFTIQNKGKSTLTGVNVQSSDANFTIEGIPASVGVGETATVTVKMSAANIGTHEATITITAPEQETATFQVSGYVMDNTLFTETFDSNTTPDGWENTGWTFANGEASGVWKSPKYQLTTPTLTVAAGEKMVIEAMKTTYRGSCAMDIYVSKDGGDFTKHQTIDSDDLSETAYKLFYIEGLEAGSYQIRFDANDNKITAVNGFHRNTNAPKMELVSTQAAAFGKVAATPDPKTYTVKNTGTGTLTVNIASDNAAFTVAPAQLNINGGESANFTVSFNYATGNYGHFAGNITVTPTYNEALAVTIAATAKAIDPNAWDEDFEEGTLPQGWTADGFSVGKYTGWGTFTNSTYYAFGSAKGSTLITPRLEAKTGDVLTWEADIDYSDEGIKVEYSDDDKATWKILDIEGLTKSTNSGKENFYLPGDNGYSAGAALQMSFTAPADGYYYLRFTSSYNREGLDNFNGFKLALKEHDAAITAQEIRETFTQYTNHQVSVTVKELVGKSETLTARFFIGNTQYGEAVTETVPAGGEKVFNIVVRLNEVVSGDAYFVVSNEHINLVSDKVAVTTKAAIVLDEDIALDEMPSGYQDKAVVKYTAQQGWNTICMPFALDDTDMKALFGEGYKSYEFKAYNSSTGEIKFVEADRRYAGYPCIVYCQNVPAIAAPGYIVTYVNFSSTAKDDSYSGVTFQGSFAPMGAGSLAGKYLVKNEQEVTPGNAETQQKGYRAYFELPDDAAVYLALYNSDGTITHINAAEFNQQQRTTVYNLQGQQTSGKTRGLNIIKQGNSVRKVIVR
ncbi:MAG: DUF1573 domain-containing protein [Prevotella sp.]|nr:DUF1573 domain-containing protein [Prevotella sp.]